MHQYSDRIAYRLHYRKGPSNIMECHTDAIAALAERFQAALWIPAFAGMTATKTQENFEELGI